MNEVNITMTKPGAHHYVQLFSDPNDPHFCVAEIVKLKDQTVKFRHYFLRTDLEQWKRQYEKNGFKQDGER